jgi:asparagine synthase (glutamine-hydrolysing)
MTTFQTGVVHWDGKKAATLDLRDIISYARHKHCELAGQLLDGPLAMVYRGNLLTHEEEYENQPIQWGKLVLTWDGRLDNREDIASWLSIADLKRTSDASLVAQYFERYGDDALSKLVGEFALVLWCRENHTLRLARSTCGARTLYYVLRNERLQWSTDFEHLVRTSAADLEVNHEFVIEYLLSHPSALESPLRSVAVVPPNQVLVFELGKLRSRRDLWNPADKIQTTTYRDDHECEEQLRAELTDAVRRRLRAKGTVFCELSGGLDSSSLVLIADRVSHSSTGYSERLQTVSCVYEESTTCDEDSFISTVEEARGIKTHRISECELDTTLGFDQLTFTGVPNPLHIFPGRYTAVAEVMRRYGSKILLTGRGGDHLFWSEPDGTALVADELAKLRLVRAWREGSTWSRSSGVPLVKLLWLAAKVALLGPLNRLSHYKQLPSPDWLRLKGTPNNKDTVVGASCTALARPSKQVQLFAFDLLFRDLGAGFFAEYRNLYVSHPYTHRPLLEFCLSIPFSQILRKGNTRSLMRRSLEKVLPRRVTRRRSKANVDEAIVRALQRESHHAHTIPQWQVCRREIAKPRELFIAFDKTRKGILPCSGALFRLLSLERWLRSLEFVHVSPKAASTAREASGASHRRA